MAGIERVSFRGLPEPNPSYVAFCTFAGMDPGFDNDVDDSGTLTAGVRAAKEIILPIMQIFA